MFNRKAYVVKRKEFARFGLNFAYTYLRALRLKQQHIYLQNIECCELDKKTIFI